jgi:uncharacterized alkaline shock family protein YloU
MASVSSDIIASYAADAAREVEGVLDLVEGRLARHKGVRVLEEGGIIGVELHLAVAWGASIPQVGGQVQARVAEYLLRMLQLEVGSVDVVIDEIGAKEVTA